MSAKKLATFKIDDTLWNQFKAKAESTGTNASALIVEFIASYIDGGIDTSRQHTDADIDATQEGIDERIDMRVREQVTALEARLNERIGNLDTSIYAHIDAIKQDIYNRIDTRIYEHEQPVDADIKAVSSSEATEVSSLPDPLPIIDEIYPIGTELNTGDLCSHLDIKHKNLNAMAKRKGKSPDQFIADTAMTKGEQWESLPKDGVAKMWRRVG